MFITAKLSNDDPFEHHFSLELMGNFIAYKNIMENRKMFFDKDGQPRRDFSFKGPFIEEMEDVKQSKLDFTRW